MNGLYDFEKRLTRTEYCGVIKAITGFEPSLVKSLKFKKHGIQVRVYDLNSDGQTYFRHPDDDRLASHLHVIPVVDDAIVEAVS